MKFLVGIQREWILNGLAIGSFLTLTLLSGCTTIRKSMDSIIKSNLEIRINQTGLAHSGFMRGNGNGRFDHLPGIGQ